MSNSLISPAEREEIQKLFETDLDELSYEQFHKKRKELRKKYHPDKFEQYEDALIRETFNEKFQRIETLSQKVESYILSGKKAKVQAPQGKQEADILSPYARFAFKNMKIEILTKDKDLKYRLFGTRLRYLERGDDFKIPKTQASIIIDQHHMGTSIGFVESFRFYLSFQENDSIDEIALWLYERIVGISNALIIHKKRIPVDLDIMKLALKQSSFLRLDAPE